jgi:hypothetical protein
MKYGRKVKDKDGIILYQKQRQGNGFEPAAPKVVKRKGEVIVIDDKPHVMSGTTGYEVTNLPDYPKGNIFILKQDYIASTEPLTSNESQTNRPMKRARRPLSPENREDSFISTPIEKAMSSFGHNDDQGDNFNDDATTMATDTVSSISSTSGGGDGNTITTLPTSNAATTGTKPSPNAMYNQAKTAGFGGSFKDFMNTASQNNWIEKGIGIGAELSQAFGKKGKKAGSTDSSYTGAGMGTGTGGKGGKGNLGAKEGSEKILGVIPKPVFYVAVVVVVSVSSYLIYRAVTKPKDGATGGAAAGAKTA